ncbi:hypothetical protein NP592_004690 [Escherichia coli]|uniref:hypothetical protein n=1 Tax=Escherichia TaxID=561 RepID=UPI0015D83ECB|nr:hypothetical protein [Escherichia coli]EJN3598830.1 hypothetical protein [Escherichia coli]EJN3608763.1 hypothetical protein [Escherichia coli]EJN3741295.1 hypothetical protein [Escherichia coli]EJN3881931.1 hypothetical protein [Escherichia coli]EJN4313254.1 hypothetical protein [Escherichia coli]
MGMIIIIGGIVLLLAIIVVGLLCKSISTSKNSVAQFCMVLLLAPLLGVAGYIIYTGIELFSNAP